MELDRCLRFELSPPEPFSLELTVRKPAGWPFLTPYEVYEEGALWTAVRTPKGRLYGIRLEVADGGSPSTLCTVFYQGDAKIHGVREMIHWMLGLSDDLTEFYALARRDPLLRPVVKDLHGMRQTRRPDIFPRLILAVSLQMAPIRRSEQMMRSLINHYGVEVSFDDVDVPYWPSPQRIAAVDAEELRERCRLGYRAETLKGIAEELLKGFPTMRELEEMPQEEARRRLLELRGIGEYSAEIVSPHPGFPLDIWSAKIFGVLLLGGPPKDPRGVISLLRRMAEERWGRWRRYVFLYILNDLGNISKRIGFDLTTL